MVDKEKILTAAKEVGEPWRLPHYLPYYADAEKYMKENWDSCIWPMIKDCDFSVVLDLACGHGRNAAMLAPLSAKIFLVDINAENIEFCRSRFGEDSRFSFERNDGCSLNSISAGELTLAYCFDAMVHFDSDVVRAYLKEFFRVLAPGGKAFVHHSNITSNPTGSYRDTIGWRNFMSKELFAHYCAKEGFQVLHQRLLDWCAPQSDCLTLFQKPLNQIP